MPFKVHYFPAHIVIEFINIVVALRLIAAFVLWAWLYVVALLLSHYNGPLYFDRYLAAVTSDSTYLLNTSSCWHRQARQHPLPNSRLSRYRLLRTHPQIPIYSGWNPLKPIADTVVTR